LLGGGWLLAAQLGLARIYPPRGCPRARRTYKGLSPGSLTFFLKVGVLNFFVEKQGLIPIESKNFVGNKIVWANSDFVFLGD
jgi:hypothetical protein